MGEIHELFVFALSLVWFAGAAPEKGLPHQSSASELRRSREWHSGKFVMTIV